MLIPLILLIVGIYLIAKVLFGKKKEIIITPSLNKYIVKHEEKLKDDEEYKEYIEWCKMKGELAADKEGFDEYRMKEYQLYKKLIKHGIGGL
ncbi:hypothetical protein D1632_10800 [Chryseobacterium nematophagum]|uniref:Uncharacterized protein n=1 Tax=Chryseobacterium nematophagum TaxID=2305228 RepID=A0A3M7LCW3_9FLAO|nr:hypothetical protein [Chryseobacterium nematophagum]RMZ60069.1 hypothetical protein D1632_10800 [Chryseobacterium nematophagum]